MDPAQMREKLLALGAVPDGEHLQKRYVFDVIPKKPGKWLRLRTNGDLTTLTLKHIKNDGVGGTMEVEVVVDDFDKVLQIIESAGIKNSGYQENKRTDFRLGKAQISIDKWPLIPPYIEIEAPTKTMVKNIAKKLGYDPKDIIGDNTVKVYKRYGIDLEDIESLKFAE
ncbi:class IV adenylate cyclase [Candidatus Saccharibacteria bacterium]|nr:class IV adenylate cyclase [Candidatus Saccharibacteria bacterium]